MITGEDQESLLRLVADYLDSDVTCMAIGGTAMMFRGYKNATKDIDLVFKNNKDRDIFIGAIKKLGYKEKSTKFIYDNNRVKARDKPLIFSRGEERFDLFVKSVFGTKVDMLKFEDRYDFIGKKELIMLLPSKEILILLKAITNREKDYEDIEDIVKKEKGIDWKLVIDEAMKIKNDWVLLDLEEKMQSLKKITFIKKEFFERLYKGRK